MATLHFMAGRAGSGKTTLARTIASEAHAVLICEDEWMWRMAPPIETLHEYLKAAAKIRRVIAPLAGDLLRLGVPVVFDFGGNSVRDREWVRSVFEPAKADHVLHYLRTDDETCRARVRRRNELQPEGVFFGVVTEPQLDEVNKFFVPPGAHEGFTVVVHDP
jgi:predicted kinase